MECYRLWNEIRKVKRLSRGHKLVGSKTRARTKTQNSQGQQESYICRPSVSLCIDKTVMYLLNCDIKFGEKKYETWKNIAKYIRYI